LNQPEPSSGVRVPLSTPQYMCLVSRTSIGPIVASNSFSLNGVIESGKEPITMRFVGLPEVPDFVATTRFPLLSVLEDLRSGEPLREC
jgi:hypothetical protein